jgi:2-phospho-L-lactate guanylyltransferase
LQVNDPGSIWALVPVKALDGAKQRLEPCLGNERGEFSFAMLSDVLKALMMSSEVNNIAVVTADHRVERLVKKQGLLAVPETGLQGMNAAIRQGVEKVRTLGASRIMIIHADIPLATGEEIDRIYGLFDQRQSQTGENLVAISPAADKLGTNLLCFDAGLPISFRYGPDSYRKHLEAVAELSATVMTIDSGTISIDIDESVDIDNFITFCRSNPEYQQTRTWQYLEQDVYMVKYMQRMQQ